MNKLFFLFQACFSIFSSSSCLCNLQILNAVSQKKITYVAWWTMVEKKVCNVVLPTKIVVLSTNITHFFYFDLFISGFNIHHSYASARPQFYKTLNSHSSLEISPSFSPNQEVSSRHKLKAWRLIPCALLIKMNKIS